MRWPTMMRTASSRFVVFCFFEGAELGVNLGCGPLTVTVTTRIIPFLAGNPYKPSFLLFLGGGTTQGKPSFFFFKSSSLSLKIWDRKLRGQGG